MIDKSYIKPIIVTGLNTREDLYIMNIPFNVNSFVNMPRAQVNNYNKDISESAKKDFNINKNQSVDVGRNESLRRSLRASFKVR